MPAPTGPANAHWLSNANARMRIFKFISSEEKLAVVTK